MSSKKKTILVDGMTCTNCAMSVTKRLEKLGLQEVNTDFLSGEVSFQGDIAFEDLSKALDKIGYAAREWQEELPEKGFSALEKKFLFALVFSIPLFLHMFLPHEHWLNNVYVQISLCTPVFLLGFFHFGKSGWGSVKSGIANMDVLIFIGSSAAYAYSVWGMLEYGNSHEVHDFLFFETCSTIITLVLLGNVIEHRSVQQTTTALKELTQMQKVTARVVMLKDGAEHTETIPATQVRKGDVMQINEGDHVPVDGVCLHGSAELNEALITGESKPVKKDSGDALIGGSVVLSGQIRMQSIHVGKETTLARIVQLVKDAQASKPSLQKLSDKVSAFFVPVVIGIALLTFFIAWLVFDVAAKQALLQSIAVLVISCPCAMGLATPTAIVAGIGRAAKNGILIKGGDTLERFAEAKHIVFDKTGTITLGEFGIHALEVSDGNDEKKVQQILFSMEWHSSHPIAKSLVQRLKQEYSLMEFSEVKETKGKGIQATTKDGNTYELFGKTNSEEDFLTLVLLENQKEIARILLDDELNPSANKAIQQLQNEELECYLLSGDKNRRVANTARQTGIVNYLGEQKPEEKLAFIQQLKTKGKTVMVGDGINDAPALAAADVGISLGDASQVAISSAQIVILSRDLQKIYQARKIAEHTLKTIRQNLFWALFYNVIAIPIAATGFLNPMVGALSMAFSDVIVIGNSIRLKTKKLS
jgi:Cu+-exporting ATPase